MFDIRKVVYRHDAQQHGEMQGLQMGAVIALVLLFTWFLEISPFNFTVTVILMGFALVALRAYGSYVCGRKWDMYEHERRMLINNGVDTDTAFEAIANDNYHRL
jgi:hypothetical protein